MKIPDIRNELHILAADIEAAGMIPEALRLRVLAEETRRRSPVRRASPRARTLTPEIAQRIRDTAQANPDWPFRRIGAACGVDGGRVSEVLAGFRT